MIVPEVKIKFCGLTSCDHVKKALELRVDYLGLVAVETSPRYCNIDRMKELHQCVKAEQGRDDSYKPKTVILFSNNSLDQVRYVCEHIRPDYIQLHGSETVSYCQEVFLHLCIPIIKAVAIDDIMPLEHIQNQITHYQMVADFLLLDKKAPQNAHYSGGHGQAFNWDIIRSLHMEKPYFLAGGLTHDNILEAVSQTQPYAVDVSSGIEKIKGVKDQILMEKFVNTIKNKHEVCY